MRILSSSSGGFILCEVCIWGGGDFLRACALLCSLALPDLAVSAAIVPLPFALAGGELEGAETYPPPCAASLKKTDSRHEEGLRQANLAVWSHYRSLRHRRVQRAQAVHYHAWSGVCPSNPLPSPAAQTGGAANAESGIHPYSGLATADN